MIEDIAIALSLLIGAAIALVMRGRERAIGVMIEQVVHTFRSFKVTAVLHSIQSNPLLRLTCLLLLLIGTGWAATITRMGMDETRRAIQFQRPSAHEARDCHLQQSMIVLNIELEAQMEDIVLATGPLDPRFGYRCPQGGRYSFDDSGNLHCSIHGSAPNIRQVPVRSAGKN